MQQGWYLRDFGDTAAYHAQHGRIHPLVPSSPMSHPITATPGRIRPLAPSSPISHPLPPSSPISHPWPHPRPSVTPGPIFTHLSPLHGHSWTDPPPGRIQPLAPSSPIMRLPIKLPTACVPCGRGCMSTRGHSGISALYGVRMGAETQVASAH